VIHPGLVRFEGGLLLFRSDEKDVPEWVKTHDHWINNTNKVMAAHSEQEGRRLAEQSARHQAEAQRIEELNEKFKNLGVLRRPGDCSSRRASRRRIRRRSGPPWRQPRVTGGRESLWGGLLLEPRTICGGQGPEVQYFSIAGQAR
jgi:ferric-dicitrate binding protein FerR (iron transport regulator)